MTSTLISAISQTVIADTGVGAVFGERASTVAPPGRQRRLRSTIDINRHCQAVMFKILIQDRLLANCS